MGKQSQGAAVSHHSDVTEAGGPHEWLGGFGRRTRLSQISCEWLRKFADAVVRKKESRPTRQTVRRARAAAVCFFFFSLALLILKASVIRMRETESMLPDLRQQGPCWDGLLADEVASGRAEGR